MSFEATFVQAGDVIDHTPSADVAVGEVVVIGSFAAIAAHAIAANTGGALATRGVFDVVKASGGGVTFTAGAAVYWDAAGNTAVTSASGNVFLGFAIEAAADADATVRVLLRSFEAATAETLGVGDLSDVGAVTYTAGKILVADGDSFESVAVSGDATLSSAGVVTLNGAHQEQIVLIPLEDLAANADISARPVFVHPRACTLSSVGFLTQGAPVGVNDSNTSVIAFKDDAGNTIVTKTYNTGTQPPTSDYEDLGALDATHKVLAAGEHVTLSVTNGTTADLPAGVFILVFVPTNA